QQVVYQVQEKKQLLSHLSDVGITVFSDVGNAAFIDPHTLTFGNAEQLESDKFILCVGGSSRRLSFPGSEHTLMHSAVWAMEKLPASVAIIGGGATGCQLASIFNAFGSAVTLMDIAPRLLLTEDTLVAQVIREEFHQN